MYNKLKTIIIIMNHLTLKAVQTLEYNQWLDDEIVDFLIENFISRAAYGDYTFIMKSTFYLQLTSDCRPENKYQRIMDVVTKCYKSDKIFDKRAIVIPICANNHWILIIIALPELIDEKETHTFQLIEYNPLGPKIDNEIIETIRTYLRFRLIYERGIMHDVQLLNYRPKLPRQRDSHNCGVFIIHYVERTFSNFTHTLNMISENKSDFDEKWAMDPQEVRIKLIDLITRLNNQNSIVLIATQNEINQILIRDLAEMKRSRNSRIAEPSPVNGSSPFSTASAILRDITDESNYDEQ